MSTTSKLGSMLLVVSFNADRVRFLIFSRQRSASNTLLNELRRHPNVTCHYEVLNIAQMPPEIGRGLNATYFTAVADLPRFMAQFWDFCPAQACGFKLFDKQMGRPLRELLQAAGPRFRPAPRKKAGTFLRLL